MQNVELLLADYQTKVSNQENEGYKIKKAERVMRMVKSDEGTD